MSVDGSPQQGNGVSLVWFKRDLRLTDHEPLARAARSGRPMLLLYVFEEMLLNDPHYDLRHWRFVWQSLVDLQQKLRRMGGSVLIAQGEVISILTRIHQQAGIYTIFSHQEVGIRKTFDRDRQVTRWCRENGVEWVESAMGPVVRACPTRKDWDGHWQAVMSQPMADPDWSRPDWATHIGVGDFQPDPEWLVPDPLVQRGGAAEAGRVMHSFWQGRGRDYAWAISRPLASRRACSRLSPYLAWGNISLREAVRMVSVQSHRPGWERAIQGLQSRLRWHSHFIQKFESECRMEFEPVNEGFQAFPWRQDSGVEDDLAAWESGQTGVPLVDACMRCLKATGWINFRMRAMLVSFLCHHLGIDWRLGVHHLARLFLDFEPGIHYPQFQMQAGMTGTNVVRIYNPVKQAQDQDPDGEFIRRWVPELSRLPTTALAAPWELPPLEALMLGFEPGKHYPQPLCDPGERAASARDLWWSWRERDSVQQENLRIVRRHVRPEKQGGWA